jgi:hypothetical protein
MIYLRTRGFPEDKDNVNHCVIRQGITLWLMMNSSGEVPTAL